MNNDGSEYPWQGMLIVSVLGVIGVFILFITGCFNITTYDELYIYISDYGLGVIFSLFFILIAIYCWVLFFRNDILKPKKAILYLLRIEDGVAVFVDKKGKLFFFSNCNVDIGKYYNVLKTYDSIKEILNESGEIFILPREKKSYWLNFYSPIGNYENIFLLPIAYVILLPGILSIIMSNGYQKIYGFIYSLFPCYVIIYDLIYKVKLYNTDKFEVDDNKLVNSYFILKNIMKVLFVIIINIILICLYFKGSDKFIKLILVPFCVFAFCSMGYVVSKILNNNNMMNFFSKSYTILFLLFWFGFLIYFTMKIFKAENSIGMILFTVPFWIVGLFVFYKNFIKKN